MSKRTFKAAMKRNRVTAELSKIINKGKPNEIKLYNLYMDKPTANRAVGQEREQVNKVKNN